MMKTLHCSVMMMMMALKKYSVLLTVVGWHASMVCRGLPCQCEERCHHVCAIRYRDPEGNWHQQPTAQAQAQTGHPGNGVTH